MCVCVCVCVCACVRACVRACVCVCVDDLRGTACLKSFEDVPPVSNVSNIFLGYKVCTKRLNRGKATVEIAVFYFCLAMYVIVLFIYFQI